MVTSRSLKRRVSLWWSRSLSSPIWLASSWRTMRLATVFRLAPSFSNSAQASRSAGVVDEKVKEPVSS